MLIYKICDVATWNTAQREGVLNGLPLDIADGYMHLSPASEVQGTLAKYFRGARDLVLVAVDRDAIADNVRDEPSRGGILFPHLYGPLPMSAVAWCEPITIGPDGAHVLPTRFT